MSVFFKNVVIRQRINFRLMDIFNHTNCAQRSKIRHKPHFECEKTVVLTSDSVKDCSDGNAFWECRGISARDYCVAYLIFDMSRNFFYVCDRCIFTFPVQRPYERCVFKFYREVLGFVSKEITLAMWGPVTFTIPTTPFWSTTPIPRSTPSRLPLSIVKKFLGNRVLLFITAAET